MRLADEVREHLLGSVEVGYDAIANGPDGPQALRRPAKHPASVLTNCFHCASGGVEGNKGRLTDDDALAQRIDAGVGGAEVDGQIAAESCERHDDLGRALAKDIPDRQKKAKLQSTEEK